MRKTVCGIMETLLLIGMLLLAFNIQRTECIEPPATEWGRTFGGAVEDVAESMVQTSDGGYAIAGYTGSLGAGDFDFWLVKTNLSGDMEWSQTYGGIARDVAWSVIQTTDGGYAMTGYTESFGVGNRDFWLVKTYANGTMEWCRAYGNASTDEIAWGVVETTDGYALAGWTGALNGPSDFWLVKTDSSGNMNWSRTYNNDHIDCAEAFIQTIDGGYAIAGFTGPSGVGRDVWLVKTDSNGNMEWNETYGGSDNDYAHSVVQTDDGGYALTGPTYSFGAGSADVWLVKTYANGSKQWDQTYGRQNYDGSYSIYQSTDEGYAICGFTLSYGAGGRDFWLIKSDVNGNMEWNETYGGSDDDYAHSVVQTDDGGYALTGPTYSFGAGSSDFWLVKIGNTPTGNNVQVNPNANVSVTFSEVVEPGHTTVNVTKTNPKSAKSGFKFLGTYYDITTTATYSGSVTVCIHYDDSGLGPGREQHLKIFHWDDDWIDVTSSIDTENNIICAVISSLSWFAVAYDNMPPTITITTPQPLGLYTVSTELDFLATDSESGVATVVGILTNTAGETQEVESGFKPMSGVYTLVVIAKDNVGNTAESDSVFFVVYDPQGGFATGGGWIYPDEESTLPDGKAHFGFVAKYKEGGSTGNLEFQYQDANINLKSTSIDWLIISGISAQFQGTGTINGEGLYTFRVLAKDNGEPGIDSDEFIIKIWENIDTEADPLHKAKNNIAGGNIKVHKK